MVLHHNVPCTITSVWDGEITISTPATIDLATGLLVEVETCADMVIGLNVLEDEYITLEDGRQFEICRNCHGAVTGFIGRWDDGNGNYIPKTGCPICDHYHLVGGVSRWCKR